MEVESLAEVESLTEVECCSASLRILVPGYILILGLKLQPNSIAS